MRGNSEKKLIKLLVFILVWALLYWFTTGDFGAIAFLLAYIIAYSVGENALLFLANEFDKNHNSLIDNFRALHERLELLESENTDLRQELNSLYERVSELEEPKIKALIHFMI